MRHFSRQKVNWLSRAGIAIICLHISTVAAYTADQLIDETVIRKWKAYERFARSIQGMARITTVFSGSDGAKEDILRIVLKQNQNCASCCIRKEQENPTESISFANPQYAAELRRKGADLADVVLERFSDTPQRPPNGGETVFEKTLPIISQHFYVANRMPLSQILADTHFKIRKMSKRFENDRELVRIDYQAVRDPSGMRFVYSGWVDLDPSRCWCIVRAKGSREVTRKNGKSAGDSFTEVEHEMIDHPSGFPLVKTSTARVTQHIYEGKERKEKTKNSRVRIDYEWEVNDHVPDSEFTLTAYGLPEPGSDPVKKSSPLYVWIILAAGISFGLGAGFRFLARRRARSHPTA
jgi:hypothetical protein